MNTTKDLASVSRKIKYLFSKAGIKTKEDIRFVKKNGAKGMLKANLLCKQRQKSHVEVAELIMTKITICGP